VAYSSDLTDAQWKILEPLLLVPSKRGPKHGNDLRHVVDAMLYILHTGCQWRFLPEEFGPGRGSGPNFAGVKERNVDPGSH
jgi:transposase